MSKQSIEAVIRNEAARVGLNLLTRRRVCELAAVKVGSYYIVMNETFGATIERMRAEGLPSYVDGVDASERPERMKPDARKQLIFETAFRMCKGSKFWVSITREEVAREAGISPALISYYFGSMNGLREMILENYNKKISEVQNKLRELNL